MPQDTLMYSHLHKYLEPAYTHLLRIYTCIFSLISLSLSLYRMCVCAYTYTYTYIYLCILYSLRNHLSLK